MSVCFQRVKFRGRNCCCFPLTRQCVHMHLQTRGQKENSPVFKSDLAEVFFFYWVLCVEECEREKKNLSPATEWSYMNKTTPCLFHPSSYLEATSCRQRVLLTMPTVKLYCLPHRVISVPESVVMIEAITHTLQLLVKYFCKVQTQVIEKYFLVYHTLLTERVYQTANFCFLQWSFTFFFVSYHLSDNTVSGSV